MTASTTPRRRNENNFIVVVFLLAEPTAGWPCVSANTIESMLTLSSRVAGGQVSFRLRNPVSTLSTEPA